MLKAVNLTKKFDDLVAVDHINAEIKSVWQPGSLKQMRAM